MTSLIRFKEPEDLVYPVYVVYRDDPYKEPFVRGGILGYMLPLAVDTPKGRLNAVLAVGATDKNRGKIVSLEVNNAEFPQMNGLSLVHFYTKEFLSIVRLKDGKLDKIDALGRLSVQGEDATAAILRKVKLGLIITDELYLNGSFNKVEIVEKIKDYIKNQNK